MKAKKKLAIIDTLLAEGYSDGWTAPTDLLDAISEVVISGTNPNKPLYTVVEAGPDHGLTLEEEFGNDKDAAIDRAKEINGYGGSACVLENNQVIWPEDKPRPLTIEETRDMFQAIDESEEQRRWREEQQAEYDERHPPLPDLPLP